MEFGDRIQVAGQTTTLGFQKASVNVFCYAGRPKYLSDYFHTVFMQMLIEGDDYIQYKGSTPEDVLADISDHKSLFSFNFLWSTKRQTIKLNPFNQTCVGIETSQEYQISLNLLRLDMIKVGFLMFGVLLLFLSRRLSENALFYYLSGICVGVFASVLILIYFLSKFLPRKPMMYGALLGGWTLVFYFGQMLWQNLQMVFLTYKDYAIYYCLLTGFVSFIVCYRYGPPKDQRSRDLIKWTLQLAALFLIFQSSDFREGVFGLSALLLGIYYFPTTLFSKTKTYYDRKFPRKRRFISKAEFERQGIEETEKALKDLKNYCSSPECRQWSTVMRLKNPSRFASFMEGSSHVLDSEIIDYETSDLNFSSDEESENDKMEENSGGGDGMVELSEDEDDEEVPVKTPKYQRGNQSTSTRRLTNGKTTPLKLTPRYTTMNRSRGARYNGVELSDDD